MPDSISKLGRLPMVCAIGSLWALVGCTALDPRPLETGELMPANLQDAKAIRALAEPLQGPLSLDEAIARALKFNLDRRAKVLEEALANHQWESGLSDVLPKVLAQAGYSWRSNDVINKSRDIATGELSPSHFISADRSHGTRGLDFSWSLLDFGMGWVNSQQNADRILISAEKRRKATHMLIQDVRTAYWRAASAQLLSADVRKTIALAEEALRDARTSEVERLRNPLDAMRYQRQLLENLRLLEGIDQELSSAYIELASLINAPLGAPIQLADLDAVNSADVVTQIDMAKLEETALAHNADLRESHYNSRVARDEVTKTMARLFPNLTLNWSPKYDTNSYLMNRRWEEAGLQLSFNLFNLISGPDQVDLAKAGVALADQRRLAMQMSVLTQVHLARIALINARSQFTRADAIYNIDSKIDQLVKSREAAQAQSKLETVSNVTTTILSLLRRYQALAQVQVAENRLMATLGIEPKLDDVGATPLPALTAKLRAQGNPWVSLTQPTKP